MLTHSTHKYYYDIEENECLIVYPEEFSLLVEPTLQKGVKAKYKATKIKHLLNAYNYSYGRHAGTILELSEYLLSANHLYQYHSLINTEGSAALKLISWAFEYGYKVDPGSAATNLELHKVIRKYIELNLMDQQILFGPLMSILAKMDQDKLMNYPLLQKSRKIYLSDSSKLDLINMR